MLVALAFAIVSAFLTATIASYIGIPAGPAIALGLVFALIEGAALYHVARRRNLEQHSRLVKLFTILAIFHSAIGAWIWATSSGILLSSLAFFSAIALLVGVLSVIVRSPRADGERRMEAPAI